jgi:hypothetical protein
MQINEIYEKLKGEGKMMSETTISRYSYQFLEHLEQLHVAHLPDIAKTMEAEGGYYMHFDSTCEAGSGSLFTVLAGWKNWVLGAWRQSTENADEMLPHVMYLTKTLGVPLAIMKDLSKQGQYVVGKIREAYPDDVILIFACHFHFVKDIGKDILYADHNTLKSCISDTKSSLARLIRDTKVKVSEDSASVARTVEKWLADLDSITIVMDSDAAAIVRHLSQWVLDSSQDGDNGQFPFELPYLLFYDRAIRMSTITGSLISNSRADTHPATYNLLKRLHKITTALANDQNAAIIAASLRLKNDLFLRLRTALQMEKKAKIEDASQTAEKREEFHRKVREDFDVFVAELRKMKDSCKIKDDLKKAVGIIITHIDKYYDELWGTIFA